MYKYVELCTCIFLVCDVKQLGTVCPLVHYGQSDVTRRAGWANPPADLYRLYQDMLTRVF